MNVQCLPGIDFRFTMIAAVHRVPPQGATLPMAMKVTNKTDSFHYLTTTA